MSEIAVKQCNNIARQNFGIGAKKSHSRIG